MFNVLLFKIYYHFFHCCRGFNSVNKCFHCTRFCVKNKKISRKLSKLDFGDFILRDSSSYYPKKIILYFHYKARYFFAHNLGEFENFGVLFYKHVRLVFSQFLYLCGNLRTVKEKRTRKTCFPHKKKRLAPRIYQAKFGWRHFF